MTKHQTKRFMINKTTGLSRITDRRKLESIIYSIIDSIPSALIITGEDDEVLLFNNTFIQLWQIPKAIIESNEKEKIFAYLDTKIEGDFFLKKKIDYLKDNKFEAVFDEIAHKNGSIIECYTVPRWIDNMISGRVWSFRDISQQKHAEQLLISQKKDLDRAHRIALLGSWTYDSHIEEFKYSDSFLEMCEGLLVHKSIKSFLSVVHSDDVKVVKKSLKKVIRGEENRSRELKYRVLNKKGDVYYLKTIIESQSNESKPQFIWGITQDITRQAWLEQSLSSAKEAAEDYNIAMDNIFSNISHEMRTPLNAILGYTNILLESSTNKVQQDYFYSIKSSGESLLSLIEDIIDISKAEKGNIRIKENRVNVRKLVNEIHKIFEQKFRKKGVGFSIEINKEIPGYIFIDESRIKQILSSLISNSLKFTEKGYVSVRFEGKATIYKDIYNLTIYIEDTGIGIAEKDQDKIFDSFSQIENSSKRNYEGAGLGLYITKRNVDLLKGTIKLHSVLNKGSIFILNFENIKTYSGAQKYLWKDNLKIKNLKFEKASILVADDQEFNKEILRHILSQYDFEIIEVANGNEAVLLAEKFNPTLIILDLKMPEMDGYTALKGLKKSPKTADIPIIAFSSREKGITREKLLKLGFRDFLSKPVTFTKTVKVLCRFLNYKQVDSTKQSPLFNEAIKVLRDETNKNLLTNNLLDSWEKLNLKKTLKEQLEFAKKLVRFGQENNLAFFTEQGELLIRSLEIYDIEKSGEILGLLTLFFRKLKG